MKKWLAVLPLSVILMGFACSNTDLMKTAENARNTLAASKGVLTAAHEKYDAQCKVDAGPQPCVIIHRATAAQNTSADTLSLFCNGNANPGEQPYATGGNCHPDASLAPKMQSATTDLEQILGDVKGLVQ